MMFTFIIINYEQKEMTLDCLRSLFSKAFGNDMEVIVYDNGSKDDSVKYLHNNCPPGTRIIPGGNNCGFAGGSNKAASFANGQYLFFLNNDTIVKELDLKEAEKELLSPRIGAVAPSLLTENGEPQPYSSGSFPSLFRVLCRQSGYKPKPGIKDWISGAALAIRKDVFIKVGRFDERFFMYFEDADLCLRLKKMGLLCKVSPFGSMIHFSGKSLGADKERKKIYYRSQDAYFLKNKDILSWAIIKAARLLYKIINHSGLC